MKYTRKEMWCPDNFLLLRSIIPNPLFQQSLHPLRFLRHNHKFPPQHLWISLLKSILKFNITNTTSFSYSTRSIHCLLDATCQSSYSSILSA